MRWAVVALGMAVVLAGCGADRSSRQGELLRKPARSEAKCRATRSPGLLVCGYPLDESNASSIWSRLGTARVQVTGPARIAMSGVPAKPIEHAGPAGFWVHDRIFRSPDRRTLLAQWSGECESQSTYLVSTDGGVTRPIFGGAPSVAIGWSRDERARVLLPNDIWGMRAKRIFRAGVYLVDPATLAARLERRVPLRRGC